MTCAGSSGGAAVALASGQVWLATGSDLGGSLRTPASFCSIVGFRPSPGRVASGPGVLPLNTFSQNGPMGRCVADVALMLDATAKHHPLDPLSYPAPSVPYARSASNPVAPKTVAWAGDFGGACTYDAEVEAICRAAAERFREIGATVMEKAPDPEGARESFQIFRGHHMAAGNGKLLQAHRELLKPEVIWNIEYGLSLTSEDLRRGLILQAGVQQRFARFMADVDIMCIPAAPVPPFPVEMRYVEEINGRKMPSYIDWVLGASIVTMAGLPAVSMPCGFTRSGLPVGLMLVGKPRGEAGLISAVLLSRGSLGRHDGGVRQDRHRGRHHGLRWRIRGHQPDPSARRFRQSVTLRRAHRARHAERVLHLDRGRHQAARAGLDLRLAVAELQGAGEDRLVCCDKVVLDGEAVILVPTRPKSV